MPDVCGCDCITQLIYYGMLMVLLAFFFGICVGLVFGAITNR